MTSGWPDSRFSAFRTTSDLPGGTGAGAAAGCALLLLLCFVRRHRAGLSRWGEGAVIRAARVAAGRESAARSLQVESSRAESHGAAFAGTAPVGRRLGRRTRPATRRPGDGWPRSADAVRVAEKR